MLCRKFSLLFLRVIVWGADGPDARSGTVDKSRRNSCAYATLLSFNTVGGSLDRFPVLRLAGYGSAS